MSADYFDLGRRHPDLARKKRAQLGVCLAARGNGGDPELQGAVRKLARDFGFRTLRDYLHAQRRRQRVSDPLLDEFMHEHVSADPTRRPRFAVSLDVRRVPPEWWPNALRRMRAGCPARARRRFGRLWEPEPQGRRLQ